MTEQTYWRAEKTDGVGTCGTPVGLFEHEREARIWQKAGPLRKIKPVKYFETEVVIGKCWDKRLLFQADRPTPEISKSILASPATIPETMVVDVALPVYNSMAHYEEVHTERVVVKALAKLNQKEIAALRAHFGK